MKNQKQLSNIEIASFCRQTAMIIRAGITPSEGMEILINDTIDENGKKILRQIADECLKGCYLYQAVESTGVFPKYVVRLISLGEESGNTDTVLTSLADYYDREEEISDNVRSAFTYPLIMIAMMIFIILILVAKVLPIFKQVFEQLGTEMTPFAEKLMSIGSSLSRYAAALTIIMAAIIIICIILNNIPSVKAKFHEFLTKFPLTRDFYMNIAVGRFASGLSLAFNSGMETFHSLEMISELVENEILEAKISQIYKDISENATLPEAIGNAGVFSNLYTRMIAVAFTSGNQDTAMEQVSEHYQNSTDRQLRKILSIIEPTLVIVLSVIVGIILLSVLLPLMGIMSSIG